MFRMERYAPGVYPPALVESVEIERLSPLNVRFRRYGPANNLLEDRAATSQEVEVVDLQDTQEVKQQVILSLKAKVAALPATNPLKSILQDMVKMMGLD